MIASGGGNLAVGFPAGIQAGDLLVTAGVAYLSTITPPGSFAEQVAFFTFGTMWCYLWTKTATGSESGTINFPVTDRGNARMYAFRNVAQAPYDYADGTESGNSGAVTNPTKDPDPYANALGVLIALGYSTAGTIVTGGSPSGGTWAEVSEYVNLGIDIFFQQVQTADLTGGGAISGGTTTAGGTHQMTILGFVLTGEP